MIKCSLYIYFLIFSFNIYAQEIGSETGYDIPRYVSLKSNQVNLRVGSSKNYPIILKYVVKNYPIEIIDEFNSWRKISDFENNIGWIHKALLKSERFAIILPNAKTSTVVYSKPKGVKVGTIGRRNIIKINKCTLDWCQIISQNNYSWVPKNKLWGVYSNEEINLPFYQPIFNLIWKVKK